MYRGVGGVGGVWGWVQTPMNRVGYPVHKKKLWVSVIIRVHFPCLRDASEAAQRPQISKFSRLQRAKIEFLTTLFIAVSRRLLPSPRWWIERRPIHWYNHTERPIGVPVFYKTHSDGNTNAWKQISQICRSFVFSDRYLMHKPIV